MKKILIVVVVFLVAAAAFAAVRFKPWLENRLESALEARGLQHVELTVSHLGLHGAALENVSLGGPPPLVFDDITLGFSLADLRQGKLDVLTLRGVEFRISQQGDHWVVAGMEGLRDGQDGGSALFFLSPEAFAKLPFTRLSLEDSDLEISGSFGDIVAPLDLALQKEPSAQLIYKGDSIVFRHGDLVVTGRNATLDAALDGVWTGAWQLEAIDVKDPPVPVPVLGGSGTVRADPHHLEIEGLVESADKAWLAQFTVRYTPEESSVLTLDIAQATVPWSQGSLSVKNVSLPLAGKEPVKFDLQVRRVALSDLMNTLTGDRVAATGTVSGTVPVAIGRDGKISIMQGTLAAEGPGTITMPPDTIPGDNDRVVLVRQILENLHYNSLSIIAMPDEHGRLAIKMAVEGENPKVLDGRPVKLNVNLTGNLLEFLEYGVLYLIRPETLFKPGQGYNEE